MKSGQVRERIARRGVRAGAIRGMSPGDKTLLCDLNNDRREGISVDGAKAAVPSGYFQIRRMAKPHSGASEWKTFLLHSGPPLRELDSTASHGGQLEGSDVRLVSSFPSTGNLIDPLRRDTAKRLQMLSVGSLLFVRRTG